MAKAIVIGTSAGGIEALDFLLMHIPSDSEISIFIVQHITADSDSYFITMLDQKCKVVVTVASHNELILPGVVYFAPPNFHLLIEKDFTLSINQEPKVNFSRPSIDVLFNTAAEAYGENLIGILLTGANKDGSEGLKKIKQLGGKTIVQNPAEAMFSEMPFSALRIFKPDYILSLSEIAQKLMDINEM